ncbi:MAG: cupin domain-containing protein [Chitinophagaceae bacterium]|nr:MAG: cupin domain-containing protein [Chitinophagaceae bacterium]
MITTLKSFWLGLAVLLTCAVSAQVNKEQDLSARQKAIIRISALAGKGDLPKLKTELSSGLEAGLTVNQLKEILIHLYAYAGFPRSIRGLQTLMSVIEERKAKGIDDVPGPEASPINDRKSKYERGKAVLDSLSGSHSTGPQTGYAAFAPPIEVFLKEHLFADIFERDILTYGDRELVTISVLSSLAGVEPMLQSHLKLSMNVGLTAYQLQEFITIIQSILGKNEGETAQSVLNDVLKTTANRPVSEKSESSLSEISNEFIFPKGQKVTNSNFTGTVWLNYLSESDSTYNVNIGSVTFEPGARTNWHLHKGGQILLITDGQGLYQERGKPVRIVRKGQVVKCARDVEHWHGATNTESMTHVAIGTNTNIGGAVWLKPVTDKEYMR